MQALRRARSDQAGRAANSRLDAGSALADRQAVTGAREGWLRRQSIPPDSFADGPPDTGFQGLSAPWPVAARQVRIGQAEIRRRPTDNGCRRRSPGPLSRRAAATVESVAMSTILLIILILLLVSAMPAWPYSRNWGYYPTGGLTLLLIILLLLMFLRRI
jgi:hypothetical protein